MSYDTSELILFISNKLSELNIKHFIVGATARDLLCKEQNISEPQRKTNDVDFGIFLSRWSEYKELEDAFSSDPHIEKIGEIKYAYKGQIFDVVAFGEIEDEDNNISVPPGYDILMNMTGFQEAFENAKIIEIGNSSIKVVTPEMLASLKIVSWGDRNSRWKDMEDIKFLLNHAENLYPELPDVLWDKHTALMEKFDYSIELAAVAYIGRKASLVLENESRDKILEILEKNKEKLIDYFQIESLYIPDEIKEDFVFNAFKYGLKG